MAILNDILDLFKIEAGHLEMECVEFDIDEVLDQLAAVIGLKAEEKGVELVYALPPRMPRRLLGDPTRLGQVLLNLASNAVKFTEHGEVLVSASRADCATDRTTSPRSVNLTALPARFSNTWPSRVGSPSKRRGSRGGSA